MASATTQRAPGLAGYDEELSRAELDIAKLESQRRAHPHDLEKRVRLAYRLFHRASLTGSMAHFEQVEAAIRDALDEFGPKEDLCLLKANLDLRFHRLADVRPDLQMCPQLPRRFEARALLADLDFQEGRYEAARLELERLIAENRTWDNLARLAHWHSKLGDIAEAGRLYEAAEDDLTAKQMRSYAWLELQRGLMALTHGRYADAWKHYRRADAAYPGHWHTDEHVAELLGAEGRFDEAAELLRQVVARSPKPELQQHLGELYVCAGRNEEAEPWLDAALAAYLDSARGGGVHYFHHLTDFYLDARPDPAEAVRWARKDLELRSNFSTQAVMARALNADGRHSEAMEYIRMALASGVRDAGIFGTAATLYTEAALAVNPSYPRFQMHH